MTLSRQELKVSSRGDRLDAFLAGQDIGLTRSRVRRLIAEGFVLLNDNISKPSQKLRRGDVIRVTVPTPRTLDLVPEDIPVEIAYQDQDLIVVDKPAGLTVHPAPGHPNGTLVNALLALCPDLGSIGDVIRPGIVHRLDKDTSGLMVVAKTQTAHQNLADQIRARTISKVYIALATGLVTPDQGEIRAPIGRDRRNRKRMAVVDGGRESATKYEVLEYTGGCSLVRVVPETGRTHQIRVHFASKGHPLFGDKLYGKSSPLLSRQFLHAAHLGFVHPRTGTYLELSSPLPDELAGVLKCLEIGSAIPPVPGV